MIEEIEEYQTRLGRLKTLKDAGIDAYPAKSEKGVNLADAKNMAVNFL